MTQNRANKNDEHHESTPAFEDEVQTVSEDDVADALAAEIAATEQPSTDLEAELAEARARALRAQAELENFRKRIRRDMDAEPRRSPRPHWPGD